jgi:hypothetical protein
MSSLCGNISSGASTGLFSINCDKTNLKQEKKRRKEKEYC